MTFEMILQHIGPRDDPRTRRSRVPGYVASAERDRHRCRSPHFSFGASVQEHLPDQFAGTLHTLHCLLKGLYEAPAPVIAAVRGQCLGGGFELALACDLIVADRSAQFAVPEIKLGVFAPAASALLPLRVGRAMAARLLLTGAAIAADEAAGCGLVTRVVEDLDAEIEGCLESDFLPRSKSSLQFACWALACLCIAPSRKN